MKRFLDCTASDFEKMTKDELLEAIAASEGRILVCETIGTIMPMLGDVTNAEFVASMGADIILLNIFDVNNPPENRKDYLKYRKNLISTVKDFTGCENPSFNTFDYNKFSTLFLSKLNNYLNETNQYVFRLEDKINELEAHIQAQNELINQMESSNSWKLTKPLRNFRNR